MSKFPKEFDNNLNKNANFYLITVDNFKFPVSMSLKHFYLEEEYDEERNL